MAAGGICSDRVTAAEDPPWGEPIAQREIYGYCPPVRPVNATSASPSGPGSTSASPPAAAAAATRAGGGGEQPTPMGWGAHGRHGPRGLASMDLGGGHPWVESPGGGGRVGGRRGAAAREWRRGEGAARVPGLAFLYRVSTIVTVRSWMDG